jgi:hypothetical protein
MCDSTVISIDVIHMPGTEPGWLYHTLIQRTEWFATRYTGRRDWFLGRLGLHYPTNTLMLVRPKSFHVCCEFTVSTLVLSHSFVL